MIPETITQPIPGKTEPPTVVKRTFITIHSRGLTNRYHGTDNPYPFPNDREEHFRLDQLQIAFRTVLGGNVLVPLALGPQIGMSPVSGIRELMNSRPWDRQWTVGH